MSDGPLLPHGEGLRRAVRWLSEERGWSAAAIQEAAARFDLSPLDEQFLLDRFRKPAEHGDADPRR